MVNITNVPDSVATIIFSVVPVYTIVVVHSWLVAQVAPPKTITISWSSGTSHTINYDLLIHCKSLLKECDYSIIQSALMTNSGQILRH